MPIDPAIPLSGRPAQVADPLDQMGKALQIRNEIAAGPLRAEQLKTAQMENQQRQMQFDSTRALNQALQASTVVDPQTGLPTTDHNKVMQSLTANGQGIAAQSYLKGVNALKKTDAELQKALDEHDEKKANALGSGAASIKAADYEPAAFTAWASGLASRYPKESADALAAAQQDPAHIKTIVDHFIAASPEQRKLGAADVKAKTGADRLAAELPEITVRTANLKQAGVSAAQEFAARTVEPVGNQDQWDAWRQRQTPSAQESIPAMFSPAAKEQVRRMGLTTEQQQTAGQAKVTETEQNRHNLASEANQRSRLGIEGQSLNLRRQQAGFEMGGGISEPAKMIAEGKLDPATARALLRRSPGLLSQVRSADPAFDEGNIENRYNTLKDYTSTSNSKAGGQILALNTMIHHADLYLEAAEALRNGSFKPGNKIYNQVSTLFGGPAPQNAALVARFLAAETGKVATGGVPAEGEIKGMLANLGTDAGPDQIAGAGRTLLQIAGGRAQPLLERAKKAKIENVVQLLGPDAQEILKRRGFDPETMKPVGGEQKQQFKAGDSVMYNGAPHKIKSIKPDGKLVLEQ